ncbi:helix-turn-helix transcriptional regulator [Rhabdobacter roseus]|uniref:AraC-like DNA-binding protein n=1 Tax=Rhabdobacter roseus TaxID=1655419 RepID=A0A840TX12_9BACT|nr:AraC family transcriptional regulator [Rhabdobacter roseus]MBB5285803.1 AraC-like DNA-binding protein [Rhabdobacter roseus]
MSQTIPTHKLPSETSHLPILKIFRFKNSFPVAPEAKASVSLPITPLPTDAPHRHNYYEILFIEEGQGMHEIDFRSHPVQAPALHFLTPGQVHLLNFTTPCQGFILAFPETFCSFFSPNSPLPSHYPFFNPAAHQPVIALTNEGQRYFHNIMDNMVTDYLDRTAESTLASRYLEIILEKCHVLSAQSPRESAQSPFAVPDLVGRFQEMVEKNFRQLHEVQQYATELHVSPDYLSKTVKKHLGVSAGEYIMEKLLLEAKRLLVFTPMSSKEISYHLHLEDPSYFGRIFKRKTGLTPNEYRASVRKSTIQ